jgi:hypothetical protein
MKYVSLILTGIFAGLLIVPVQAQKKGLESINRKDLKKHMLFLASDELEGRDTGEPGMEVAARYLAVQAESLGLKPADPENGYLQPFIIEEKAIDRENSNTTIHIEGEEALVNKENFYLFPPPQGKEISLEGEVVFAGYGINDEANAYNDFEDIDVQGKVVLIMNRAPMNEDGTKMQFDHDKWNGMQNMQYKLPGIFQQGAKAVLLVFDPKSGYQSIEDMNPGIARYLGKSRSLKKEEEASDRQGMGSNIVLIHRSVANQLLSGSGKNLEELQQEIDRNLVPQSFALEGTSVKVHLQMETKEVVVSNVFGLIEGSDPLLKEEAVIYLAHYDHVGTDGQGGVFNGADDNASGTVALLEIAEAFMVEKKRPKRSIGFLWVAAEEIGLFGSQYFADFPLVPAEQTAAVINLDMVGRTKTPEDAESNRTGLTIVGGDSVKVIGGMQSKVLMKINEKTLDEMGLVGNYTYNDLTHSERYFYRSDHISFARKDIPVLFYSTGTHADYHMLTDVEERLDYDKFLKMARFCYKAGFNVARYPDPIEVDNPMSGW